jgi:hypothetical protein
MVRLITYTLGNNPSANSLIACGFRLYAPAEAYAGKAALYWWKDLKHASK